MNFEEHALALGKIVANLQALEFTLRLFLCGASSEKAELPKKGAASIPKTHLTNFDLLGTLVNAYNRCLSKQELSCFEVHGAVVLIRDSLAHGRLLSTTPSPPVTLYKFGRPAGNTVPVERVEILNKQWLDGNADLIAAQI